MKEHEEDIKNTRQSNSMADVVRSACKICDEHVKVTMMRGHTKAKHKIQITEYKEKFNQHYYDLVELVLHKCGVCEEYVLLDSDAIAAHLKSNFKTHNLTHGNYNAKYMVLQTYIKKEKEDSPPMLALEAPKPETTSKETNPKSKKQPRAKKDESRDREETVEKATVESVEKEETISNLEQNVENKENVESNMSEPMESSSESSSDVSLESFRKHLAMISREDDSVHCPTLELLLNLNIFT